MNSGDGNLVTTDSEWTMWNSATMSSFIAKAHQNGTRVIVSINVTASDQVCAALSHTQTTISQTVQQVQSHGGTMEVHIYDADHAFVNDTRPEVYSPDNAKLAWDRATAFLHARLG